MPLEKLDRAQLLYYLFILYSKLFIYTYFEPTLNFMADYINNKEAISSIEYHLFIKCITVIE